MQARTAGQPEGVVEALSGAAAVLRMGGTAYFVGHLHADAAQQAEAAEAEGERAEEEAQADARLWQFEVDGDESELRLELYPAAVRSGVPGRKSRGCLSWGGFSTEKQEDREFEVALVGQ